MKITTNYVLGDETFSTEYYYDSVTEARAEAEPTAIKNLINCIEEDYNFSVEADKIIITPKTS